MSTGTFEAFLLECLRCRVRSTAEAEAVEAAAAEGAEAAPGKELVTEKAEKALERDGEDWELGKVRFSDTVRVIIQKRSNIKTDYFSILYNYHNMSGLP